VVLSDGVNPARETDKSGSHHNAGSLNTSWDAEKHKLVMKWKAAGGNSIPTLTPGRKSTN